MPAPPPLRAGCWAGRRRLALPQRCGRLNGRAAQRAAQAGGRRHRCACAPGDAAVPPSARCARFGWADEDVRCCMVGCLLFLLAILRLLCHISNIGTIDDSS